MISVLISFKHARHQMMRKAVQVLAVHWLAAQVNYCFDRLAAAIVL
jgi:hypothetical protein